MNFAVPADHKMEIKESEMRVKYIGRAWELIKLWNMSVMIIPIIDGALETVGKCCNKSLDGLEKGMNVNRPNYSVFKIGWIT